MHRVSLAAARAGHLLLSSRTPATVRPSFRRSVMSDALRHLAAHPLAFISTVVWPSIGAFVESEAAQLQTAVTASSEQRVQDAASSSSAAAASSSSSASLAAPAAVAPSPAPSAPLAQRYCCLRNPSPSPRFLIVGLGNPGAPFTGTRHNVARDLVQTMQREWSAASAAGRDADDDPDQDRLPPPKASKLSARQSKKHHQRKSPPPEPLPPHLELVCASRVASIDSTQVALIAAQLQDEGEVVPGHGDAASVMSDSVKGVLPVQTCSCLLSAPAAILEQYPSASSAAEALSLPPAFAPSCRCRILLACPDVFMNLSGRSVSALSQLFRIPAHRVVLLYDDVSLELGRVRVKTSGGAGGQNGVRSVLDSLGGEKRCEGMIRVRIGIGPRGTEDASRMHGERGSEEQQDAKGNNKKKGVKRSHAVAPPAPVSSLAHYVLQRFTPEEEIVLRQVRRKVQQAIVQIVTPTQAPIPVAQKQVEQRFGDNEQKRAAIDGDEQSANEVDVTLSEPVGASSSAASSSSSSSSSATSSVAPSIAAPLPSACCRCSHSSESNAALARRVQLAMTRFNGQRVVREDE